jgi:hypothetical protein
MSNIGQLLLSSEVRNMTFLLRNQEVLIFRSVHSSTPALCFPISPVNHSWYIPYTMIGIPSSQRFVCKKRHLTSRADMKCMFSFLDTGRFLASSL